MEKMGGGGHLANAATQIKGKTIAEVKQTLIDQLAKTEDDGNKESTEEWLRWKLFLFKTFVVAESVDK